MPWSEVKGRAWGQAAGAWGEQAAVATGPSCLHLLEPLLSHKSSCPPRWQTCSCQLQPLTTCSPGLFGPRKVAPSAGIAPSHPLLPLVADQQGGLDADLHHGPTALDGERQGPAWKGPHSSASPATALASTRAQSSFHNLAELRLNCPRAFCSRSTTSLHFS